MTDSLEYHGPVYGRAPRALLRDPSISASAKALWTLLEDHASPESPVPFPSQELLAEYLGVTDRTIRSWLNELVASGWVVKQRTSRSNRYRLAWKNRSDRNQASGHDRNQASGHTGRRLPTKKNQEEEPIEEPLSKSEWSTQEGQLQPVDNSAPDGDEYHPPPSGRRKKEGGGWMEEWNERVRPAAAQGERGFMNRTSWPEITKRAAHEVRLIINERTQDEARIAFGDAYKRLARQYAAVADARNQPANDQQRDIPMIGRRI